MGILSTVTGLFTGGTTWYWKYIAIAVVVLALMGWSYEKGVSKSDKVIAQYQLNAQRDVNMLGEITVPVLTKIVTHYVNRTVTIHDNANTNALIIQNDVPDKGILSQGWVSTHDAAAQGLIADPVNATDNTPSGVSDIAALEVINDNYATCNATKETLIALQASYKTLKQAVDSLNRIGVKK